MSGFYSQPSLEKHLRDAMIVVYFGMDFPLRKSDLELLEAKLLITPKHPKGWMCTSSGREYVRRLK